MKIENTKPPMWEEITKAFKIDHDRTVFTHGDTIFNPSGAFIPDDLEVHEHTHMRQQMSHRTGPEGWWKEYIKSREFRFAQEVEAYAAQYAFKCTTMRDRNQRSNFLVSLATMLSSEMYSVDVSRIEAYNIIKNKSVEYSY